MQCWYVYLMRCADDSLYCGITTDVERRLKEHNAGTASKYTRSRRPVCVAAAGMVADKSAALKLEMAIKKQDRVHKIVYLEAHTSNLR
ncbi:GIY-YIG nuclease family protein [Pseudodesulfovibrio sp. JC047]|uniref:GIY-YIG nuclease family protein n=1 Tax=Pseudodesulfovibrio sp. JC047 TaxID=2683199 RepID=UPI0013D027DD|nr:GIY-YIG nuclease family protein [Pseudodesulfovibrio sp. JC047]NDV20036.1 GIY-YIG nuclease family protein [Pseudodesulfovibrio sp. JC047]